MSKHVKPLSFVKEQRPGYGLRKKRFPWRWVILVGALVVLGFGLLQQSNVGAPTAYKVEVQGTPRIAAKYDTVNHGDQHYNVQVESLYSLGNIGDKDLLIIGEPRIEVLEGCCPPRIQLTSRILRPGEESMLSMRYSMHEGMDGPHHFLVRVRTNDPVEPEKLLHAYSNWIP